MIASVLTAAGALAHVVWLVALAGMAIVLIVGMAGVMLLADSIGRRKRPKRRAAWWARVEDGYRREGAGAHRG